MMMTMIIRDERSCDLVTSSTILKTEADRGNSSTRKGREMNRDNTDGNHSIVIGKVFNRIVVFALRVKTKENDFNEDLMRIDGTIRPLNKGRG